MQSSAESLSDKIEELQQQLIRKQLLIAELQAEKQSFQQQVNSLIEQLRLLRTQRFGPRSEKMIPGQRDPDLFNEAGAKSAPMTANRCNSSLKRSLNSSISYRRRSGLSGTFAKNTPVRVANRVSKPPRYRRSRFRKASLRRNYWRLSSSAFTRMRCRCIANKRSSSGSALNCRAPNWRSG